MLDNQRDMATLALAFLIVFCDFFFLTNFKWSIQTIIPLDSSCPNTPNLYEPAHQRRNLCLLIAPMRQSILNLTQSLNNEDLHIITHIGQEHLLVNSLDDVVKGEGPPELHLQDLGEGLVELVTCEPGEDHVYFFGGGSTSDFVDCVDGDFLVGHGTGFQNIEDFSHVATRK